MNFPLNDLPTGTPMYVPATIRNWNNITLNGEPFIIKGVSSIGYVEVFSSLEALQKVYGTTAEYVVWTKQ